MIDDPLDEGSDHIAPLAGDAIPDVNQAHYCFSCQSPMQAVYCGKCGQRNDDFRRSITSLITEAFGAMFGFESRIWRTWAALFIKPGKVAREYCDGRRMAWSSPVRVYLAMSIILFGFMGCTGTQIFSLDVNAALKDGVSLSAQDAKATDIDLSVDVLYFDTKKAIRARNAEKDFDLIRKRLSLEGGLNFNFGDDALDQIPTPEDVGITPKDNSPALSDGDNDNAFNITSETLDDYALKVLRNPELLNRGLFTYLPRIMFFMMPLSMLLGAIFIRGKRALLYDHLVHSAYIHAVTFMLIFIGILIAKINPSPIIAISICIIIAIYLPISLKTMFSRGWFKTIITSYCVGFTYLFVIMMITLGAVTLDIVQQISGSV